MVTQAAETLHRLGYRGLRARGLKGRLLPRFWRRFQRPPRVGLNPARLRGIRTLAQRLRLSGGTAHRGTEPGRSRLVGLLDEADFGGA